MRDWKRNERVEVCFDEAKEHRLKLSCTWDSGKEKCLYIMFNPSTADLRMCDMTLNRCISFAKSGGFGGYDVVNLYSYRTLAPKELRKAAIPSLPENTEIVKQAMNETEKIIIAWGSNAAYKEYKWVLEYAEQIGKPLYCFGKTKNGSPKHPLFLSRDTKIIPYTGRRAITT